MGNSPFISVIVVCKNPGPRIQKALGSVWSQTCPNCELVVIDGGSSDGTHTWLHANSARISHLIIEEDGGIYDAMNKGVNHASGTWLYFLGADDRLAYPNILLAIAGILTNTPPNAIVSGSARYDNGREYQLRNARRAITRNFAHHQATFYHRNLFQQHGNFDTSLRLMADYDLNLRMLAAGVSFRPLDLLVAECGSCGISDAGRWLGYREEILVRHRHFPPAQCLFWDVCSLLRFFRKAMLRKLVKIKPDQRPNPSRRL